jgi:hypothetical protein
LQGFVAYYRVSTDRQGQSGLGLDAQRSAVAGFVGARELVAEFMEVESGKRTDRPQLTAAMDLCRRHKAVLVIAKLDRLARNVAFIANLMESGVEFTAVDMPSANKLTLHILAAAHPGRRRRARARDDLRPDQSRAGGRQGARCQAGTTRRRDPPHALGPISQGRSIPGDHAAGGDAADRGGDVAAEDRRRTEPPRPDDVCGPAVAGAARQQSAIKSMRSMMLKAAPGLKAMAAGCFGSRRLTSSQYPWGFRPAPWRSWRARLR